MQAREREGDTVAITLPRCLAPTVSRTFRPRSDILRMFVAHREEPRPGKLIGDADGTGTRRQCVCVCNDRVRPRDLAALRHRTMTE